MVPRPDKSGLNTRDETRGIAVTPEKNLDALVDAGSSW